MVSGGLKVGAACASESNEAMPSTESLPEVDTSPAGGIRWHG